METHNLTINLTRGKAIDMLLDNPNMTLNLSIDCDVSREDLQTYLENMNFDIDNFCDDCEEHRKYLINQRKELDKLETHELYEKGEKLGYWKLNEKQKRLI